MKTEILKKGLSFGLIQTSSGPINATVDSKLLIRSKNKFWEVINLSQSLDGDKLYEALMLIPERFYDGLGDFRWKPKTLKTYLYDWLCMFQKIVPEAKGPSFHADGYGMGLLNSGIGSGYTPNLNVHAHVFRGHAVSPFKFDLWSTTKKICSKTTLYTVFEAHCQANGEPLDVWSVQAPNIYFLSQLDGWETKKLVEKLYACIKKIRYYPAYNIYFVQDRNHPLEIFCIGRISPKKENNPKRTTFNLLDRQGNFVSSAAEDLVSSIKSI
jgi:hypothetical protein